MATPRGWTCCAPPALKQPRSWYWPWTTWTSRLRDLPNWCSRISRQDLEVVARARDVSPLERAASNAACRRVERELFESSLRGSGHQVLELLGRGAARRAAGGHEVPPAAQPGAVS
jgi:hypothetical protein